MLLMLAALVLTIGADAQRGNGVRRASSIDNFAAKGITTADGVLSYREALINAGSEGKPALVLYMPVPTDGVATTPARCGSRPSMPSTTTCSSTASRAICWYRSAQKTATGRAIVTMMPTQNP